MSSELLTALIAMISGGGITALIQLFIDNSNKKRKEAGKAIDDRILLWQKMSEKHEGRIHILEKKLESYDRDFWALEQYVILLEQILIRDVPSEQLPERPVLEKRFHSVYTQAE
jgi:hypothetical protein